MTIFLIYKVPFYKNLDVNFLIESFRNIIPIKKKK